MTDDIQRMLGSIDAKIDSLTERMDRQNEHLFGQHGIEYRLRSVENEQSIIRGKTAVIAAVISAAIASIATFFHWSK